MHPYLRDYIALYKNLLLLFKKYLSCVFPFPFSFTKNSFLWRSQSSRYQNSAACLEAVSPRGMSCSHESGYPRRSAFESVCLLSLSLSFLLFKYTTYTAQPLRKLCEHVKRGVCVDESESRGLWYADVAIINSDEVGRLSRLAKLRLIWLTL